MVFLFIANVVLAGRYFVGSKKIGGKAFVILFYCLLLPFWATFYIIKNI